MLLNKPIMWPLSMISLVPLSIIIFEILDYFVFNSFGITSILVLCCFTPIYFLRRNYNFNYTSIVLLYLICISGAFLIGYFKEQSIFFFIVLFSWISLSKNMYLTQEGKFIKDKLQEEESNLEGFKKFFSSPTRVSENKRFIIDFIVLIGVVIIFMFVFNFIRSFF